MKLVDEYMNWVTGSMDERFHDDQWMKRFTRCKVDLEDAAANDADVESNAKSEEDKASVVSDNDASSRKGKEVRKASKSSKDPHTPVKGKKETKKDSSSPDTPRTTALTNKLRDMSLVRNEATAWVRKVLKKPKDTVPLPGVDMQGINERFPPVFAGGGDGVAVVDFASDVITNPDFGHLDTKAKVKLAITVCTPTFGTWVCNVALLPRELVCVTPPPREKAQEMELHRISSTAPSGHYRFANVLFGIAAANSELLTASLVAIQGGKLSQSISVVPLDTQFSRMWSMIYDMMSLSDLKVHAFNSGLTINTRMVNVQRTAGRANTKFKKLLPTANTVQNTDEMPEYLKQRQLHAGAAEIPIYDATEYFSGKKLDHSFRFGVHDVQCPRLRREIKAGELVAVMHSVSSYWSTGHTAHGLAFNVYYAVLLASPNFTA
ncbi:hypothetical protein EIP86_010744 [Pleurotus ostreatoroseus]|nr:hypothetical protein EIP86_010744 [Pleurotus ostreatoroseus]